MVRKRVPGAKYGEMVKRGEALDLLILVSNGNPRIFLQTLSKWMDSRELSKRSALAASNNFVASELTAYHLGLRERLPKFSSHIDLGMAFVKAHLVPELQKKNAGKGAAPSTQTIYFTMDREIPYKVLRSLSLLEYSGFLFAKGVVKTAQRKQAPRFALHLGVSANEKVFQQAFSRDPDQAVKLLSLTDYREFYSSDSRFEQLLTDYPSNEKCPNNHPRQADGMFCPVCGARFAIDKVIERLLDDKMEMLSLTTFQMEKLRSNFGAIKVRDVIGLTESELQSVKWIGPIRARQIVNAAEEYISG